MNNDRIKEIALIKEMYDAVYSEKAREIGWKIRESVFGPDENIGQNCILSRTDIDKISQNAGVNGSSKILDIGCGDGSVAVYLAKKYGCFISGVDFSTTGIETARRQADKLGISSSCQFFETQATQMPFEEDHFDLIYSLDSFIHIYDKKKILNECKRVLKPKGKIIFYDWVDTGGLSMEIQSSGKLWGYIYIATSEQYIKDIKDAGLSLLSKTNNSQNFTTIIEKWEKINFSFKDYLINECGQEYFDNSIKRWGLAKELTKNGILGQNLFICEKA